MKCSYLAFFVLVTDRPQNVWARINSDTRELSKTCTQGEFGTVHQNANVNGRREFTMTLDLLPYFVSPDSYVDIELLYFAAEGSSPPGAFLSGTNIDPNLNELNKQPLWDASCNANCCVNLYTKRVTAATYNSWGISAGMDGSGTLDVGFFEAVPFCTNGSQLPNIAVTIEYCGLCRAKRIEGLQLTDYDLRASGLPAAIHPSTSMEVYAYKWGQRDAPVPDLAFGPASASGDADLTPYDYGTQLCLRVRSVYCCANIFEGNWDAQRYSALQLESDSWVEVQFRSNVCDSNAAFGRSSGITVEFCECIPGIECKDVRVGAEFSNGFTP